MPSFGVRRGAARCALPFAGVGLVFPRGSIALLLRRFSSRGHRAAGHAAHHLKPVRDFVKQRLRLSPSDCHVNERGNNSHNRAMYQEARRHPTANPQSAVVLEGQIRTASWPKQSEWKRETRAARRSAAPETRWRRQPSPPAPRPAPLGPNGFGNPQQWRIFTHPPEKNPGLQRETLTDANRQRKTHALQL